MKLEAMCMNALYCIYPIESNLRLQVVMINFLQLACGVSQGFMLGPLQILFLL